MVTYRNREGYNDSENFWGWIQTSPIHRKHGMEYLHRDLVYKSKNWNIQLCQKAYKQKYCFQYLFQRREMLHANRDVDIWVQGLKDVLDGKICQIHHNRLGCIRHQWIELHTEISWLFLDRHSRYSYGYLCDRCATKNQPGSRDTCCYPKIWGGQKPFLSGPLVPYS